MNPYFILVFDLITFVVKFAREILDLNYILKLSGLLKIFWKIFGHLKSVSLSSIFFEFFKTFGFLV